MKKRSVMILSVLALIVIVSILSLNTILKFAFTGAASYSVGAPVKVDSLDLRISKGKITIKGFKIMNPKGFSRGILADVPLIDIEFGKDVFVNNALHFTRIEVVVKGVSVIKNKDQKLNINELRPSQDVEDQTKMLIDTLVLSADKAVFMDYTAGSVPTVKVFNINIKENTYTNITSAEQLSAKIIAEIIGKTTIRGAAVYGAAALAGVTLTAPIAVPLGAAYLLSRKDNTETTFNAGYDTVFDAAQQVIKDNGKLASADNKNGAIKGTVDGVHIVVQVASVDKNKTNVIVSGRKFLLPKPTVAAGVLSEISKKVKK